MPAYFFLDLYSITFQRDDRLLTLDPVSISYILKNYNIYQKPALSRGIISRLIGCGMLAAEGHVYKRQRRVIMPAFSLQHLRDLVPIVFQKGLELKDTWTKIIEETSKESIEKPDKSGTVINIYRWIDRATFDVIGLGGLLFHYGNQLEKEPQLLFTSGFGYSFNAIADDTNELFCAYKQMFELGISQVGFFEMIANTFFPSIQKFCVSLGFYKEVLTYRVLKPTRSFKAVERCRGVIERIAGQLIQEKKAKIIEGEKSGIPYQEKDMLTRMRELLFYILCYRRSQSYISS